MTSVPPDPPGLQLTVQSDVRHQLQNRTANGSISLLTFEDKRRQIFAGETLRRSQRRVCRPAVRRPPRRTVPCPKNG
ncbi:hypothetical protein GN956_G23159 [Arapaima gigas]